MRSPQHLHHDDNGENRVNGNQDEGDQGEDGKMIAREAPTPNRCTTCLTSNNCEMKRERIDRGVNCGEDFGVFSRYFRMVLTDKFRKVDIEVHAEEICD